MPRAGICSQINREKEKPLYFLVVIEFKNFWAKFWLQILQMFAAVARIHSRTSLKSTKIQKNGEMQNPSFGDERNKFYEKKFEMIKFLRLLRLFSNF